jgi:phosphate transport system permease protein
VSTLEPGRSQWTATSTVSRARRVRNALATTTICLSVLLAAVPLVLVVAYLVRKGASVMGWAFLTEDLPLISRRAGGGVGPAVLGTLLITGAATAMAIPLGVLAAIYLNEYGGRRGLASTIRFLSDVMAGVPSIVMGLFVYTAWVLRFGQTGFAGALALACLMLPIVIRSAETALSLVPTDLREASTALGARRSRTILSVVVPSALPGILTGALLAIARVAGETAPLLFTIGVVSRANPNLFEGSNTALSTLIFANARTPFIAAQDRAWGAALTLVALVFLFTFAARLVARRFTLR